MASHPAIVTGHEHVGVEILRIGLIRGGGAVQRTGALDLEDGRSLGSVRPDGLAKVSREDLGGFAILESDPVLDVPHPIGVGDLAAGLDDRLEDQVELDRPAGCQPGLLRRPVIDDPAHDILLGLQDLSPGIDVDPDVELRA